MKNTILILSLSTLSTISTLHAAVPLRWTVETSRAQVAQFDAYRGETLALEAALNSYGTPLESALQPTLYWQTNGMGSAWWTAPATASGNVVSATWSPTNDCGAASYNCFIGSPESTYRAAFRLRMLPSPGFTPNVLRPPATTLDESDPVFRAWVATNEFNTAGVDTNAVRDIISQETNERFEDIDGYLHYLESAFDGHNVNISDLHDRADSTDANVANLNNTVSAWQTYWDGDDVRVTVTNYYGAMDIPSLYIEQKMAADDEHENTWFKIIWDERTRWNAFLQDYAALTNHVHQYLADRAWGIYDSSTGAYSPDGLLQLSQEKIMVASGMAWQKTVTTGGGSVWILTSTIPFVMSGESTNGFFRIEDGDGHSIFEIVKGDKKFVPATPTTAARFAAGFSVGFSVDSAKFQHPVGEVALDVRGPYVPEDSLDGLAVTWNGESGNWIATVAATPPHAMPKMMFFRATYETGGNTYIRNNVATSIDKVVIGGREYSVTVETVNGKKLLVLE